MKVVKITQTLLPFIFFAYFSNALYSQNKQQKELLVESLLKTKNGEAIFTQLIDNTIKDISVANRSQYRNELEAKAKEIISEATYFFLNKYSLSDLQKIYKEYRITERITRSKQTEDFAVKWKEFKAKYQRYFAHLYSTYKRKS